MESDQTAASGRRWPLAEARAIAERIREQLAPYCERIEIAGSIRRGRPDVGDVDLVLIPRPGRYSDIVLRAQQNATVQVAGIYELIVTLQNGLQVDLYFARAPEQDLAGKVPGNWGMVLLVRTGSEEHNIALAQRATQRGLHFATTQGILEGNQVRASETEDEIFAALGLEYVPPEQREAAGVRRQASGDRLQASGDRQQATGERQETEG